MGASPSWTPFFLSRFPIFDEWVDSERQRWARLYESELRQLAADNEDRYDFETVQTASPARASIRYGMSTSRR